MTINGSTLASSNYSVSYYTDADRITPMNSKNYVPLTEGTDYELEYVNNVNKGKAVIVVRAKEGSGSVGSKQTTFTITAMKIKATK